MNFKINVVKFLNSSSFGPKSPHAFFMLLKNLLTCQYKKEITIQPLTISEKTKVEKVSI